MAHTDIFSPTSAGVSLAATAASGHVDIKVQDTVRVVNLGPNKAYIKFGADGLTAATTDMCMPPGTEVFYAPGAVAMAAICDTDETATLKAIAGNGY